MRKPPLKRFPDYYSGDKEVLTWEERKILFENPFIVEEKLDGTLTLMEYGDLILMLEDMLVKHSVFYSELPGRFILVDVIEKDRDVRLDRTQRIKIYEETGYSLPPYWEDLKGIKMPDAKKLLYKWVEYCQEGKSSFGSEPAEGFVVKSEKYLDLGGKYSRLDLVGEERYNKSIYNKIIGYQEE